MKQEHSKDASSGTEVWGGGAERERGWLRRLDNLGPVPGVLLGVGVGLCAGYGVVASGHAVGLVGGLVLLGGATALAFGGEPVLTEVRVSLDAPVPAVLLPPIERKATRLPPVLREPLAMIQVPGGTFLMGSPEEENGRYDSEGPQHRVRVDAFVLGRETVTQRLYQQMMGENPGEPKGDDLPVNKVSWHDAVRFCNRLSEQVGLTPCYRIPEGEGGEVTWDRAADGYRLPTEAEWEHAARAGTQTAYPFGDDPAELDAHAWYGENAKTIMPVGQKKPNPFGLHDMLGNVWEWCWDIFGEYEGKEPDKRETIDNGEAIDNPTGPLSGEARVLRGGSFGGVPRGLRSAVRVGRLPTSRNWFVGFRCARGVRRQP